MKYIVKTVMREKMSLVAGGLQSLLSGSVGATVFGAKRCECGVRGLH